MSLLSERFGFAGEIRVRRDTASDRNWRTHVFFYSGLLISPENSSNRLRRQ
jgi:hypothetical protein